MFCKYCGKQIEPGSTVCPHCGKAQTLSGGVGFWDMIREEEAEKKPEPDKVPDRSEKLVKRIEENTEKILSLKKEFQNTKIMAIVAMILCFAVLILMGAGFLLSQKWVNEKTARLESQIREQDEKIRELTEHPGPGEKPVPQEEKDDSGVVVPGTTEETETSPENSTGGESTEGSGHPETTSGGRS